MSVSTGVKLAGAGVKLVTALWMAVRAGVKLESVRYGGQEVHATLQLSMASCGQLQPPVQTIAAICSQLWLAAADCSELWQAVASCSKLCMRPAAADCGKLCGQLWPNTG